MIKFLCFGLFFASHLWAMPFESSLDGDERGNGGDAVVCYGTQEEIHSVELLDYWEADVYWKMGRETPDPTQPFMTKVFALIDKLKDLDPPKHQRYSAWAHSFMSETNLMPEVELKDIPDSLIWVFPKGCRIEQIAIQKRPLYQEDPRYIISQDLWELMDENNRAGLILHEIIYRDAIERGQTNSQHTRYFNAKISSTAFGNISLREYETVLDQVNLEEAQARRE